MQGLDKFRDLKILVVGDILLDHYIYGRVDRISPEAPVPILTAESESYALGGAANVAHNVSALGCEVSLAGCVGRDDNVSKVISLCHNSDIQLIAEPAYAKTETKVRLVSDRHQVFRYDLGARERSEPTPESLYRRITKTYDLIVCSDYNKGLLDEPTMAFLRSLRLPIVADPKPANFPIFRSCDILTPNVRELYEAARTRSTEKLVEEICMELNVSLDTNILVTCGGEGMYLSHNEEWIKGYPVEEKDPTGAGDVATAALGACLAAGLSMRDSALVANRAAAISVTKLGTYAVGYDELIESLESHSLG